MNSANFSTSTWVQSIATRLLRLTSISLLSAVSRLVIVAATFSEQFVEFKLLADAPCLQGCSIANFEWPTYVSVLTQRFSNGNQGCSLA